MSRFAALALYPLWAASVVVGLTALRLGRSKGRGLVAMCLFLACWVTGLVLFQNPPTAALAERVMPAGVLLAGAFVHAGADMASLERRGAVWATYALTGVVAVVGAIEPRLLYGPGARGPGPLFVPVAVAATVASAAVFVWLARMARAARGHERRRRVALAAGCVIGSFGGGGAIALQVLGVGDIQVAAPLLLAAVGLAGYSVLVTEQGRARELIVQGLVYALITATLSAFGLVAFYLVLPALTPDSGRSLGWLMLVTFFAALPLEPLRLLIVERVGRALFANPIGVRDLAERVERTEARADHVERLAEIGTVASAVAHEIRNPLGVIAAQAKLLERAGASATSVAALRAQVDRAKRFLDDLLRYSKPRPLDVRDLDVLPALQLAATGVRQALGDGAPTIDVAADPDLGVEADRAAFNDVATALIGNAAIAVAGREGGRVSVRATGDRDAVVVTVEDDGPGVPPEIESTLFQPFVTGRGRDATHPGTGLGLAIASRWVERHGGTLRHERPEQGGARFVARWPRRAV